MADVAEQNEVLMMAPSASGRRTLYWLAEAVMCKQCRAMHYFFVNGSDLPGLLCTGCAPEEGQ